MTTPAEELATRLAFMQPTTEGREQLFRDTIANLDTDAKGFFLYIGKTVANLLVFIDALMQDHPQGASIAHALSVTYEIDDYAQSLTEQPPTPET